MEKWFDVPEKEGSSVICSRVRLVRNWREYPFPGKMTKEQSVEMTGRLMNGVKESGAFSGSRSRYLYLDRIPDLERTALLERRAISRGVSKKKAAAGLVLSEDERLGITINGDDHIRIQAVEKGAALTECYRRADQMEELLGSRFEYSFDEKYGYLTSFPTSVGTGLRASVVLHLPPFPGGRILTALPQTWAASGPWSGAFTERGRKSRLSLPDLQPKDPGPDGKGDRGPGGQSGGGAGRPGTAAPADCHGPEAGGLRRRGV